MTTPWTRKLTSLAMMAVVAASLSACSDALTDPTAPQAQETQSLATMRRDPSSPLEGILAAGYVSYQTSPWYAGWTNSVVDSAGNRVQIVGIRPSTAVPVRSVVTYLNGTVRERRTLFWEPALGGWELIRISSTMYTPTGAVFYTAQYTPDALGLTSFLSSECRTSAYGSMGGCFSGVLQTVGGFVTLAATAVPVAAAEVPTAGMAGVAWIGGWVAWTGLLIDTVESCSASGGSANQKPTKRYR